MWVLQPVGAAAGLLFLSVSQSSQPIIRSHTNRGRCFPEEKLSFTSFQTGANPCVGSWESSRAQAAPHSCMGGLSARAVLDMIQILVGSLEWNLNVGLDSLEKCSKIPVFESEFFPESICINAAAVMLPLRGSCRASLCVL